MNYPTIRFRDSFLLIGAIYNDIEASYMPPQAATDERYKLQHDTIAEKMNAYEAAWRPYERRIVEGMCQILNLEFQQNVIDIYGAPFYRSFSFPVVIATKYEPDRAVEVIAHELLHVLLYDNTSTELNLPKQTKEWGRLFGDISDEVESMHVPVHATLQMLFDDILHEPERTVRDKQMCENSPSYARAWRYVEKVGYKTIIAQLQ